MKKFLILTTLVLNVQDNENGLNKDLQEIKYCYF